MQEHQIEPELKRNVPRRVRRRGTRGYGTLFSQIFLIPFLALCLGMIFWFVHSVLVRTKGPIISCQIVDRYRKMDSDNKEWLHYLSYRARINGKDITERELVDSGSYEIMPIGSTAKLQISPIFPGHDSVLLIPDRDIWGIVWLMAVASILAVAGMAAMIWYIYILPVKGRSLAVRGLPVVGTLTDKSTYSGSEAQAFYFHYQYSPLQSDPTAVPLAGKQSVRQSDWDKPQPGETYTVLYDPKNPQFSVLYLYGDYEAVA